MTKQLPPPDRETIEKEVSRLIDRSPADFDDIARWAQRDPSQVSRMFNPQCTDRHNPVYQFVIFQWAFDMSADGLADQVQSIVERERALWLPDKRSVMCDRVSSTKNIGTEFLEAVAKEMEGSDLGNQFKEFWDIREAVDMKLDEIRQRIRQQKFA